MEYVEGKTVADDLAAGNIFEEKEALDIIIQVAHALAHAHAHGLIHRDVKPKNIMISKDGVVKLADMGLAREITDIKLAETEAGKAYGTPYYIAPEQIRGKIDIDGRADIYGLGCTFYHMVTGQVPFMADDSAEVMRKHLREPLTPPDHINTSLTAGVSETIEVMMAKRRKNRYNNVEELVDVIIQLQNGIILVAGGHEGGHRKGLVRQMIMDSMCKGDPAEVVSAFRLAFQQELALLGCNHHFRHAPAAGRQSLYLVNYTDIVMAQNASKLSRRKMCSTSWHKLVSCPS